MCLTICLITTVWVNGKVNFNCNEDTITQTDPERSNQSAITATIPGPPLGINNIKENSVEFLIYPNPASTNLTVSFNCATTLKPEPVYLYVTDMRGRVVVAVKEMMNTGSTYTKELDVRDLPHGDYTIRVIKGDKLVVKKFQVYY